MLNLCCSTQRQLVGKKLILDARSLCKQQKNVLHPVAAVQQQSRYSSSDPDFLQHSLLPTMHFQASLPRLPIPKLEETCKRYLASQLPLLNDEQMEQTRKVVKDFQSGEGKSLDAQLRAIDKKNKHTSYISGIWFDMYLKDRRPVTLNHNPFIGFKMDDRPEYNDQLLRATNMTIAAARFKKTFLASKLEPEVFHLNAAKTDNLRFRKTASWMPSWFASYYAILNKAFPLDMSQYFRLMNSTRLPKLHIDELLTDPSANQLAVMRNGHIYVFDVFDKNGNVLPPSEIQAHFKFILEDNTPPAEHPLGFLTSESRDTWAKLRAELESTSAANKENLRLVDTALFCLSLDDHTPEDHETMTRNFLYGDGANRWFDKSFNLMICKNGMMALNFEHSWGDGVAVLRFFNESYDIITNKPPISPDSKPAQVDSSSLVKRLDFDVNQQVADGIRSAKERFLGATSSLGVNILQYNKYGKNFLKSSGLSPDSVLQLSFQMAYWKQTGTVGPTYESCSTAAFKHGRTETVRSATPETKACSLAFAKGSEVSNAEKYALMKACSDKHNQLTMAAAMGKGWDRHLFALRKLAESKEASLPIFHDPAYAHIISILLSTSTLSTPGVLGGAFAPVTPTGYGIGYNSYDNELGVCITSYPGSKSGKEFTELIGDTWDGIREVIEATKK